MPQWEYAAYRLAATFCGILVLGWSAPRLGNMLHNWYLTSSSALDRLPEEFAQTMTVQFPMIVIWALVQFAMGLYLLLGAPHLIRWRLRVGNLAQEQIAPSNPRNETDATSAGEGNASETE